MDGSLTATERPLGVAIMAMGGQGGGVLADWIVALAEGQGWQAQSTSVPGVAQRTGATIYYVEIIRPQPGRSPVLSLMPVPGDVDVVIAAEMMEAGRAIMRGLVSPDRTTLIASSHRALAVTEKAKPGDGRADSSGVVAAAHAAARRFLAADMQALAECHGSVISAALFGALAGSAALPFPRAAFEDTVRAAGVGVAGSLKAFAAGFDAVVTPSNQPPTVATVPATVIGGTPAEQAELARALRRVDEEFPPGAHLMLRHGLRRLVDFQDVAYAHEYLDRVARLNALDSAAGGFALTVEAARQVAVAMSYDDVIRVADLKTRASRFDRVRAEVVAMPDQLVGTVRIHLDDLQGRDGVWWGSRLAVHAAFRKHGRIGMTLIRLAVSSARARGCSVFLAHVQVQNQPLFEKLHWKALREEDLHRRPHVLMQAELAQYPPCHDPLTGLVTGSVAPTTSAATVSLTATSPAARSIA